MICLSIAPKRIGQLDFLIPFLYNLKKKNKNIKPILIFFNKDIYESFKKNIFLFSMMNEIGRHYILSITQIPVISKILRACALLPFCFLIMLKRNILLVHRSIDSPSERLLYFFSFLRGKAFTYLGNNTYNDLIKRYFDSDGKPINRKNDRVRIISPKPGDGLLVNSKKSFKFLKLKGYKKFIVVGFPFLGSGFQSFIKSNSEKLIFNEIQVNIRDFKNIDTILINKFWGRWSSKDMYWLTKKCEFLIKNLKKKNKEGLILIRAYPVFYKKLNQYLKRKKYKNVHITYSHPSALSYISDRVYSIAQSSVFISCLSFPKPYIEVSNLSLDQKKLYPRGSMYSNYKMNFAKNSKDLKRIIFAKKINFMNKKEFSKIIGHKNINFEKFFLR